MSSPLNQKQTSQPICRDFQNGGVLDPGALLISIRKTRVFERNRRRRWKRADTKKGRVKKLFEIEPDERKKLRKFLLPNKYNNSCRFFHGAIPNMGGGAMPQLQNGASAYYAQQQQQSQPPGGGQQQVGVCQPIPGGPQHHHYQYQYPAGQEPNVINGVIIIATRKRLVEEVGISSSCTLGLRIRRQNSHRI